MKLLPRLSPVVCFGAAAAAVWFGAGRAESQDLTLPPTYGQVKLRAGFTPDPHTVRITSGGALKVTKNGVTAWVANASDYRLYYNAGTLPLTFRVKGNGKDTTLLINTPDGKWHANDDSDGTLDPRITFDPPLSGRYDIWVGTFGKTLAPGTLHITELK